MFDAFRRAKRIFDGEESCLIKPRRESEDRPSSISKSALRVIPRHGLRARIGTRFVMQTFDATQIQRESATGRRIVARISR